MQMRWRRYVVKSLRRFMRANHPVAGPVLPKTSSMRRNAFRMRGADL